MKIYLSDDYSGFLKKLGRIMRILCFLILTTFTSVFASKSTSQIKVSLDINNGTLENVIQEIENQTEFLFVYNKSDIDYINDLSIDAKRKSVEEILSNVLNNTDIDYSFEGLNIVLLKRESLKKELSQPQEKRVKGKVTDENKEPLPGVTITILGTTKGVITDNDGRYDIEVNPGDRLVFSFIGMESKVVDVANQTVIDAVLAAKTEELEDVTVVAFGKQKKESVISSIQTIKAEELRVPSSNLTTAFAGRMAGVISYQTSGEPGQDNAEFFIRGITSFGSGKVDPLILIDNVEVTTRDLSRMHPDDIQSFSILKDATATALYGARGANGVILVTTKEGKEGKVKVSVRVENSFSQPTREVKMADAVTYMQLANEAVLTRNPLSPIPYTEEQIDNTISGGNPYVYPSVDWIDMLTKDVAVNQRANINISGGGKVARYYIAGSISQDNGILNVDKRNNFNSNINLKKYLIRSNININLTQSTEAIVRVHGTFDDYIGPISGGSTLYKQMLRVSPSRFPAYYAPDENYQHAQHILFGGFEGDNYLNPYAEMVKGYREESKTVMLAQLELKQDFGQWVDGLTGRLLGNTSRYSAFDLSRSYSPFYYDVYDYDRFTDTYLLEQLNPETGTEYLDFKNGYKTVSSTFYVEGSMMYNKSYAEKHNVSGMLVLIARNELTGNAANLAESLPKRNLGLSGRFTYEFDSRYFTEFNFGYNGSEKFDKGHRWGFFPSIGLGWVTSNESFWKDGGIRNIINKLKIRGTYGLVGNDAIGEERFFYLSRVNIGEGGGYGFGYDFNGKKRSGVSISNYPNSDIGWEIAYKSNLGIELGLFDGKIDILADFFREHRTNILQERSDIPTSTGLWATPQVNVGEAKGQGLDISLDYNHTINNDLWLVGRANFTFAKSTFKFYEEPDYSDIPWRSRIGQPISQKWGYVAERLFIDDADVLNAARQDFGEYGPGDIKYKDINNDGVINEIDLVPIGSPSTPEINYGFGLSAGYKSFDASFFFQGSGRSSFWIDAKTMSPFVQSWSSGKILETGLAQFIADDYWSETSQNPYAAWPRLSNYNIDNNTQRSTWFMQDGSFLRLKSVELGYSLPQSLVNRMKLRSCRVYVSGTNLFTFSDFDLWDVEMGGNGLGYPLQRVINLGVNLSF